MSSPTNTLAGLLLLNDGNVADVDFSDLLQDAPLLQRLAAVRASEGGTVHKYLKETVAPTATFRPANTGVDNQAGEVEMVTVNCAYLDGHFARDVALADGYRGGRAAYMDREVRRQIKSMLAGLEASILGKSPFASDNGSSSGSASSSSGTGGHFDSLPECPRVATLAGGMVVNAGGHGGRSVWLLRSSDDGCAIVAGNEGRVSFGFNPDTLVAMQTLTGTYMALAAELGGWFAMQYGTIYDIGRIANLDSTSGHTLTDAMLSNAIARFPATRKPNLIVMDPTLAAELRNSRTATNPTGAEAALPREFDGIEIVVTDQLKTDEATVA